MDLGTELISWEGMAVCPVCLSQVSDLDVSCPKCSGGGVTKRAANADFDVPDLVVPPKPVAQPKPQPASTQGPVAKGAPAKPQAQAKSPAAAKSAKSRAVGMQVGEVNLGDDKPAAPIVVSGKNARGHIGHIDPNEMGHSLDDDPFADTNEGVHLEVDMTMPASQRMPAVQPPGPDSVSGVREKAPEEAAAEAPKEELSPEEKAKKEREDEAKKLANYGEVPKKVWELPLYAYRVWSRHKQLRADLVRRRAETQETTQQLEDTLVAIAERGRPVVESKGMHIGIIEAIRRAEDQMHSLDSAMMQEVAVHRADMTEFATKVSTFELALSQHQIAEKQLIDQVSHAQGVLSKTGGGKAGPQSASPEVLRMRQALQELEARLGESKKQVADLRAQIAAARAEQAAREKAFQEKTKKQTSASEDTRKRWRTSLTELGRKIASDTKTFGDEYGPAREEVTRLSELLDNRKKAQDSYELALTVFDKTAVMKAVAMVAAATLILLALIIIPFALKIAAMDE